MENWRLLTISLIFLAHIFPSRFCSYNKKYLNYEYIKLCKSHYILKKLFFKVCNNFKIRNINVISKCILINLLIKNIRDRSYIIFFEEITL